MLKNIQLSVYFEPKDLEMTLRKFDVESLIQPNKEVSDEDKTVSNICCTPVETIGQLNFFGLAPPSYRQSNLSSTPILAAHSYGYDNSPRYRKTRSSEISKYESSLFSGDFRKLFATHPLSINPSYSQLDHSHISVDHSLGQMMQLPTLYQQEDAIRSFSEKSKDVHVKVKSTKLDLESLLKEEADVSTPAVMSRSSQNG